MAFFRQFILTPELARTVEQLKETQDKLRHQIQLTPLPSNITTIAGCDSAFVGDQILSVFVVFSFPELKELEVQYHVSPTSLPYIPGFLAFREIPNLLLAFKKLSHQPEVIMVDGHGISHPRRMGIATHLGILTQIPTIGIAKKKLVGKYLVPDEKKGSYTPLHHQDDHIGFALRSRAGVKPIFVSPGHLCDHDSALELTLNTLDKYKLPKPTMIADKYSKQLKLTLEDLRQQPNHS
jgi:deoxyribonuclease V